MKMAKKFMALALAAVLSVGCAFCVSADGSRTKDVTVSQEQSQIYEIIQKIEDTRSSSCAISLAIAWLNTCP